MNIKLIVLIGVVSMITIVAPSQPESQKGPVFTGVIGVHTPEFAFEKDADNIHVLTVSR